MIDPIALDRQFTRWDAGSEIDIDFAQYFDDYAGTYDWAALLERRRVVILAEAGSGKSTEFRAQAKRLNADGRVAFITTLQKIGQRGSLQSALGVSEWRRYEQWRTAASLADTVGRLDVRDDLAPPSRASGLFC